MLLYLNLAYFLPSLPTLLLQSLWDARLDSKFGIAKAATVRLCIGWAAALLLLVRWWGQLQAKADSPESSPLLEDESVVLHSSQHSLDPPGEHHSRYHAAPHSSDQAEAGLIEQQGTGGYEGSDTSRASSCNRGVLPGLSKRRRLPTTTPTSLHDELERGERSAVSLESMGSSQTGRSLSMPSPHAVPEWGYQALAQDIWPAVLALVLSVSTSILVFPFFPYVPSDGRFGDALPQVLFAARVISDMAGRLIPLLGPLSSKQGLLSIAAAKAIMTPIFFLYIGSGFSHYSDWAAVLYITLFWLLSGYVNNCAYVMASCWAPSHATAAKAGGLMALVFQTSSLMALLLAFWIEHRYFAV
ncbi:hypothetical protein ABBQ38_003169 [Trebouxia sp. C0009 RCD-2024]